MITDGSPVRSTRTGVRKRDTSSERLFRHCTRRIRVAVYPVTFGSAPPPSSLRLKPNAVARPALASQVRPALVLAERQARSLIDAATANDVSRGGLFSTSPACIQIWDRPWETENSAGDAIHLGSVDWSYDTPVKHYVTIYRAMVTDAGHTQGETTLSILGRVLALTGIPLDGARVSMAAPPARDPFRRSVAV